MAPFLFFDEADTFFAKRSEGKDAHERYANIEINFCSRIEQFHAIAILAATTTFNWPRQFAPSHPIHSPPSPSCAQIGFNADTLRLRPVGNAFARR
jgi:hypothetical protein